MAASLLHLLQRWHRGLIDASERMMVLEARNQNMETILRDVQSTLHLITRQVGPLDGSKFTVL